MQNVGDSCLATDAQSRKHLSGVASTIFRSWLRQSHVQQLRLHCCSLYVCNTVRDGFVPEPCTCSPMMRFDRPFASLVLSIPMAPSLTARDFHAACGLMPLSFALVLDKVQDPVENCPAGHAARCQARCLWIPSPLGDVRQLTCCRPWVEFP